MTRPAALERGTEVRSRRAMLKRRIGAGDVDLAALLRGQGADDDEAIALDIKIGELLRAVPGVGPANAQTFATRAGVASDARLSTITIKRRAAIADALGETSP